MIVGHAAHVRPVPATVWLAAAVVAGLVASFAMDVPMSRLTTGWTPATVAASVVQGTLPSNVSRSEAVLLHHAAGPLAAVVYAVVGIAASIAVPPIASIGGLALGPHLLAACLGTVFVYGLFAWIVLPKYGGDARDRPSSVRRDWLVSATVFGLVLAVTVPAVVVAVW